MTVESTTNRVDYTGTGNTDEYDYTFRIVEDSDLRVIQRDDEDVETVLVLDTDYTVSGAGDEGGGSITLLGGNLPSGYTLTIRRVRPLLQDTDIRNQGSFHAEIHEDVFDHHTMVDQQQQDELDRSIKLPETVDPADFDNELPVSFVGAENRVLMTNADGDGWALGPTADQIESADADAAAAAASATAAAASQSAAATSATSASDSATAAAGSATSASTSAGSASTSATNAANSVTAAATSATNAANSATAASISETNAANSATAAASSASDAADSAAAAATSEANAAASAAAAGEVVAGLLTSPDLNDASTGNIDALDTDSKGSIRLTGAVTALRGIDHGADGRIVFLNNASGADIQVNHLSSSAAAGDKIHTGTGGDLTWKNGQILIVKFDATNNYWKIAGGSGSGGSGSNFDLLVQKLQNEKADVLTEPLDNSVGLSMRVAPTQKFFTGSLLENYTSGGASMAIVWNAIAVNDSDKNLDSTSSWSAVGAGASLSTSATSPKLGSNKFTFNKDNSATTAGIRYDRGSQNLSLVQNYRAWFWIEIPSLTNLTDVYLRIYADSTSNYRTWTATTNYAGSALTTGWNLICVDISTGGTATGSGWTYTSLSRYVEIGVTASSSGQTYTAIAVDGLQFSYGAISEINFNGLELTIYDNSAKNDILIDSANTRYDGPLTLASSVATSYTAGLGAAASAVIKRSVLVIGDGVAAFDSSLTAGAISLSQGVRACTVERESVSQGIAAFAQVVTPQIYKVTSVGSGSIGVQDDADTSANLVSGDVVDVFETRYFEGERFFIHRSAKTLSSGSSHSSGTTTVPLDESGIVVGDFIAKRHIETKVSVVGKTANESFQSPTLRSSPNGVILVNDGIYYPNRSNVYAHYTLSGPQGQALKDQSGNGRALTAVGSPTLGVPFRNGRTGYLSSSTANYVRGPSNELIDIDANATPVQVSFWFYFDGTNANDRCLLGFYDVSGAYNRGWRLQVTGSSTNLNFGSWDGSNFYEFNVSLSIGWHHVVVQIQNGVRKNLYLDTVVASGTAVTANISTTQSFYLGVWSSGSTVGGSMFNPSVTLTMSDVIIWKAGSWLTQSQVNSLYNAGVYKPVGFNPQLHYSYDLTGQTGQKLSVKNVISRTTTAVSPGLLKAGAIKSG